MVSDPHGVDTFAIVFVHHARGMCGASYPRAFALPHSWAIPLHSRGRRTREASHGEGGLQAAGEVRTSPERGSASQPGCNARSRVNVKCDAQAKNPARGGGEPLIR